MFFIPPNLIDDYKAFLQTSVCHDISRCSNLAAEEPVWIDERAEITAINYKSKQYGSDNAVKINVAFDSTMAKGDMLKYNDKIYIVTWQVNQDRPNAKSSIIELTNVSLDFIRRYNAEADKKTGAIITQAGDKSLFGEIRCIAVNGGGYEYKTNSNNVGITPNDKLNVYLQYNDNTKQIRINDKFKFYENNYKIVDVIYTELNYDGKSGLLVLKAEKVL